LAAKDRHRFSSGRASGLVGREYHKLHSPGLVVVCRWKPIRLHKEQNKKTRQWSPRLTPWFVELLMRVEGRDRQVKLEDVGRDWKLLENQLSRKQAFWASLCLWIDSAFRRRFCV